MGRSLVNNMDDSIGDEHIGQDDLGRVGVNGAVVDGDRDVFAVQCCDCGSVHEIG